jgi:hypothetical protein
LRIIIIAAAGDLADLPQILLLIAILVRSVSRILLVAAAVHLAAILRYS